MQSFEQKSLTETEIILESIILMKIFLFYAFPSTADTIYIHLIRYLKASIANQISNFRTHILFNVYQPWIVYCWTYQNNHLFIFLSTEFSFILEKWKVRKVFLTDDRVYKVQTRWTDLRSNSTLSKHLTKRSLVTS